jgi:hypothetical protein
MRPAISMITWFAAGMAAGINANPWIWSGESQSVTATSPARTRAIVEAFSVVKAHTPRDPRADFPYNLPKIGVQYLVVKPANLSRVPTGPPDAASTLLIRTTRDTDDS